MSYEYDEWWPDYGDNLPYNDPEWMFGNEEDYSDYMGREIELEE